MGLSVIYPFFSYVVYEMCEFLIFGNRRCYCRGGEGGKADFVCVTIQFT